MLNTGIFTGQDSFVFIVSDGRATDTETITIDVNCNHCRSPLNGAWEIIAGNVVNNQEVSPEVYEEDVFANFCWFQDMTVKSVVKRWVLVDEFVNPVNAELNFTKTSSEDYSESTSWGVSIGAERTPITVNIAYDRTWTRGTSDGTEITAASPAIPCYELMVRFYEIRAFEEERVVRRPRPSQSIDMSDYLLMPKDADGNPILAQSLSEVGPVAGQIADIADFTIYKRRVQ